MREIEYSSDPVAKYVFDIAGFGSRGFWMLPPPDTIREEIKKKKGKVWFIGKSVGNGPATYEEGVKSGYCSTTIYGWECEYVCGP